MAGTLTILGLESSCDDTAAAVVRQRGGATPEILSSVVFGQTELHSAFGGVVPEIAARAHAEKLDVCVAEALGEAKLSLTDMDAIAVTAGPGLIGGVLSGVMCAKGLSAGSGVPMVGVNHLAGHALTPRLTDQVEYPYMILLVSGGHCQFLRVDGPKSYRRLGGTIDDAPGEAFDKTARLIALPQPGGPSIEKAATAGDAKRFGFPKPLLNRPGCDMSFSGLKTAVLRERNALVEQQGGLHLQDQSDLAASFQATVAEIFEARTRSALQMAREETSPLTAFAVAGGVAANLAIQAKLETVSAEFDLPFIAPPLRLCTDNAAMIAYAGMELFRSGQRDGMELSARPRWPLDQKSPTMLGSGRKGAKA